MFDIERFAKKEEMPGDKMMREVPLEILGKSSYWNRPENTNLRGSITVQLTSCLTGFDLTKQVKLMLIQQKQSCWNQTE